MAKLSDGFLESEVEERYSKRFVSSKCVQIDISGASTLGDPSAPIALIGFPTSSARTAAVWPSHRQAGAQRV